ncbi:cytochrome C [Lutibacter sp.]|uniref:cytochrome C n=1 Tax=Lutibacter sp. TaxID=1925666 RepID=UPI002733A660|nr:cytochrome C [Lutibacter sp.]MDP3312535.1 cytochrome C [Lutibacter sp.]
MTAKIKVITQFIVVCLFTISCKHSDEHKYHTVIDKIEANTVEYKGEISSDIYNETIKKVEVIDSDFKFLIPERKSQIVSYKCSECHSQPLEKLKEHKVGEKAAHWNIKLNHAGPETMNCTTCHNKNDFDHLQSLTNSSIDFNFSYKLCSQCHQKEFKDWKGGAHGKQLGGWAPPRLSNTCVNCHNPHNPKFEKRWPVRFNTTVEKERE